MLAETPVAHPISANESHRAAIEEQIERLLQDSHFSHSKRFPAFLRFVVQQTLAGQPDVLKERTLGIEIFGRDADYDTASDPIVRVTAAEIRKRIAQYYQDPGHEQEIRISLPSGSYVPQFHWPHGTGEDGAILSSVEPSITPPITSPSLSIERALAAQALPRRRIAPAIWALFIAVLVCTGASLLWNSTHRSGFDFFWGPVLNSGEPVLLCIADQNQYPTITLRDAADPTHQFSLKDNLTAVVIDDLNPIVKVAGILQSNGRKYTLKGEGMTTLMDLRSGPTIFIGAFDNAWTLRLTNTLRYHFTNNQEMTKFGIVDSQDKNQTRWIVDRVEQMATNNYRDYAIVARFTDTTTGKLAVVAAGIGRGGTIAAGEFLADPAHLAQLMRAANAAGNRKNMEFVLSTQIIDGEPGTPKVEATYFW
jgi:hypothetical protein